MLVLSEGQYCVSARGASGLSRAQIRTLVPGYSMTPSFCSLQRLGDALAAHTQHVGDQFLGHRQLVGHQTGER